MTELENAFMAALEDEGMDNKLTVREAKQFLKAIKANMPHAHQAYADHEKCDTCGKIRSAGNHR